MAEVITGLLRGIPVDMVTSVSLGVRRLQVDQGQTGFFAGREMRSFYEFTVGETPVVIRVTVPAPLFGIIVSDVKVLCYQGGILMRSWRDGTEGGVWLPLPVIPNNGVPDVPGYLAKVTIDTGGTLTGMTIKSDATVALANAAGLSANTSVSVLPGERGLGVGVYYIELTKLTGTNPDALGVISAVWEERLPENTWISGA